MRGLFFAGFSLTGDIKASMRRYIGDIIAAHIEVSSNGFTEMPDVVEIGHQVDDEKVARCQVRKEELRA